MTNKRIISSLLPKLIESFGSKLLSGKCICGMILGFALLSCSDNNINFDLISDEYQPVNPVYISIVISNSDSQASRTRDDSNRIDGDKDEEVNGDIFNKGVEKEFAISPNYSHHAILLFDNNGDYVVGRSMSLQANQEDKTTTLPALLSIDKSKLTQLGATANSDSTKFTLSGKVLVMVNSNPIDITKAMSVASTYGINGFKSHDSASYIPQENLTVEEKGVKYFTMSSSIILQDNNIISAFEDNDGNDNTDGNIIFSSNEIEALANPITLYVERLAAKHTLGVDQNGYIKYFNSTDDTPIFLEPTFDESIDEMDRTVWYREEYEIQLDETGGSISPYIASNWKINIVGWGINGEEKQEYTFKNLNTDASYFQGWNPGAPLNKRRNYWAESCHYGEISFPDQYREVLLNDTIYSATDDDLNSLKDDLILNYYPYTSFSGLNGRNVSNYSSEHTISEGVITEDEYGNKKHLRAATHVIVAAQLLLDTQDQEYYDATTTNNGFIEGIKDKYYAMNSYMSKKAYLQYAFYDLCQSITSEIEVIDYTNPGAVFKPIEKTKAIENNLYQEISDGIYQKLNYEEVENLFDTEGALIKGGDGWAIISLKEEDKKIFVKTSSKNDEDLSSSDVYKELDNDLLTSLIYNYTEPAKHFKEGRMYYAIPIQHNENSSTIGTSTVKTGDLGAVRNHWYNILITQVKNVGAPVDDPYQPIVPNPEPKDISLGVEIEILPWHLKEIEVIY